MHYVLHKEETGTEKTDLCGREGYVHVREGGTGLYDVMCVYELGQQ